MSLFPRFVQSELGQVARLLDEISQFPPTPFGRSANPNHANTFNSFRSFQPRFDVKESKDAYELTGELPGVTDINVEFVDASTLTVKGRTNHSREEGTRPAGLVNASETEKQTTTAAPEAVTEDSASDAGSNFHKASVEDENPVWVETPAESTAGDEAASANTTTTTQTAVQEQPKNESKYWLSERSVGEFSRTFTFPARVDQDAVKATLKDGILSVTVPKAAPATKRIAVL